METFITILATLIIIISCYYINRHIVKNINNSYYGWEEIGANLLISILFPFSVVYWIIYIVSMLPSLPEEPPKWL
jgi:NADH:ubiquinone oxidoreductase subunit 6 (subunit J)